MVKYPADLLYSGLCTVYEYFEITDNSTGITGFEEKPVYTDIPCRLVYKLSDTSTQGASAAYAKQEVKLILANDIFIKDGSKISVFQNGVTKVYQNSGEPLVYSCHQEIILKTFNDWV